VEGIDSESISGEEAEL